MPSTYKVLGQSNPSVTTLTTLYTVPSATQTVAGAIVVCNRSGTATSFRISVAPGGAADALTQYVAYDTPINGNDVVELALPLTLQATDVVRCYATLATLTFSLFGEELT